MVKGSLCGLRKVILTVGFIILLSSTGGSRVVTDSIVEQLMAKSAYRDAVTLLTKEIGRTSERDSLNMLYYLNRLSFAHLRLRNIDSAMLYAQLSLKACAHVRDSELVSNAWKVAAYAYNNKGELDSAMHYTHKMLGYANRHGNIKLAGNAMTSLGTLLMQNERYGEAQKYFRAVHKIHQSNRDSMSYGASYYNMGLAWLNLKGYDSCLYFLEKSAEYAARFRQKDILVYAYGTMADCFLVLKREPERKKYLILATRIAEDLGNYQFVSMGYSNLTEGSLVTGNYQDAIGYATKALAMLEKSPYPVLNMKIDSMLYVAYRKSGRDGDALKSLESYLALKNTIVGEKQKAQLDELISKLQASEKDLLIARLTADVAQRQRNKQLLLIVFVAVILLLTGYVVFITMKIRFRRRIFQKEKDAESRLDLLHQWHSLQKQDGKELHGSVIQEINQSSENVRDRQQGITSLELYAELRTVFEKQKLYLDPEINQEKVLLILGTSKKYLNQAFNDFSEDNFRSFINRYRIDEAKNIIEQFVLAGEKLSIETIYVKSGFNNPVSFYRAFKNLTGLTPKEYYTEFKKDPERLKK